ncbi:MAG: methionine--tRNA ligase, partial [Candidatus Kryptonium sp.]
VLRLSSYLNKYVDVKAPWSLAKSDEAELRKVLYTLTDGIYLLANLLEPFMPNKMKEVFRAMECEPIIGNLKPYSKRECFVKEKPILFPKRA